MPSTVKLIRASANPNKETLATYLMSAPWRAFVKLKQQRLLSVSPVYQNPAEMLRSAKEAPFVPSWYGYHDPEMLSLDEMSDEHKAEARGLWVESKDEAIRRAERLVEMNSDDVLVFDLLAPYRRIPFVVSSTDWPSFVSTNAKEPNEYEYHDLLQELRVLPKTSQEIKPGRWHLPFVDGRERLKEPVKVSVGRCYVGRADVAEVEAVEWHDRLLSDRYLEPFEHVAQALLPPSWSDHYRGFRHSRQEVDDNFIQIGMSGSYRAPSFVMATKTQRNGSAEVWHFSRDGVEEQFKTRFKSVCNRFLIRPRFSRLENVGPGGVCNECRLAMEWAR